MQDMKSSMNNNGVGGAVYFFGLIGAAVYYIGNSVGFGGAFIGLLKALVWPAFLVYHLLTSFGV